MDIKEFINGFKNHPILFIGAGFSLRYSENSYNWEGLLKKISFDLCGNDENFYNLKEKHSKNGMCSYESLAEELETNFNDQLIRDRNGSLKSINDIFFEKSKNGESLSRFKIYISELFKKVKLGEAHKDEIEAMKKASKNIGSIITTNYDTLLENILGFEPIVGNNILLTNPYGSIYKIHGCVNDISRIIITQDDYTNFNEDYKLIQAQLISLFIHHPIVFIGYKLGDQNVQEILKTIFKYVRHNTGEADKIRKNFLFVEYEEGSRNETISDYDVLVENGNTIRISQLKTDNYKALYDAIASLVMHISVMEVRKAQNVLSKICIGDKTNKSIVVRIADDPDELNNSDYVVAMGTPEKVKVYEILKVQDLIDKYFDIIERKDIEAISIIDKLTISKSVFFPMCGFFKINGRCTKGNELIEQQKNKIKKYLKDNRCQNNHTTIDGINNDNTIASSYKHSAIMYAFSKKQISENDVELYLKNISNKNTTDYKRLLCFYDMNKYK